MTMQRADNSTKVEITILALNNAGFTGYKEKVLKANLPEWDAHLDGVDSAPLLNLLNEWIEDRLSARAASELRTQIHESTMMIEEGMRVVEDVNPMGAEADFDIEFFSERVVRDERLGDLFERYMNEH